MLAGGYISVSAQIAMVAVPVAVYFLLLGLLNSRSRPQLLSGRQDFAILIVALSPLFVLPVLRCWGLSPVTVLAAVAAVAAAAGLLGPRGNTWVIYNLPARQARQTLARTLESLGLGFHDCPDGFALDDGRGQVRLGSFPLLRNTSIRLADDDPDLARRLESALSQTLADCRVETSPMAMALLLVATAMLVAPLALMAQQVPELVRQLTNLLP